MADDLEPRLEALEVAHEKLRERIDGNGSPGIRQKMVEINAGQEEMLRRFVEFKLEVGGQLGAMWKKLDGRPSWSVAIVITILSSLVAGLGMALFK